MVFQFLYRGTLARRSKMDEVGSYFPTSLRTRLSERFAFFGQTRRWWRSYLHRRTGFAIRFHWKPTAAGCIQHSTLSIDEHKAMRPDRFCGACMIDWGTGSYLTTRHFFCRAESDGFSPPGGLLRCSM